MKKVFAILAVAGLMAACNSGENKEAKLDSAVAAVDSAVAAVDSAVVKMDSAVAAVDSAAAKVEVKK